MKIVITGHRSDKLIGGRNIFSEKNNELRNLLFEQVKVHLENGENVHLISGMALGVDTIFLQAGYMLQREYGTERVILEGDAPYQNMTKAWSRFPENIKLFNKMRNYLEEVPVNIYHEVFNSDYKGGWMLQKRNEYMVNQLEKDSKDYVLCVFDGNKERGTWNCIEYAFKKGIKVERIDSKTQIYQGEYFE